MLWGGGGWRARAAGCGLGCQRTEEGSIGNAVVRADAFSFSIGADLGAYHHERNHTGAFLRANLATRLTSGSGLFFEPRFVAGYQHSWVDADDYWLVDDQTGQIRVASNGGSANVTYGLGYTPRGQSADRLSLVLRPVLLDRAPYNGFAMDQIAVLAGVEWRLGGGR